VAAELAGGARVASQETGSGHRLVWVGICASVRVVTREQIPGYRFVLYDVEPNDMAKALVALLNQNVDRWPTRGRTARRIPRPVVVHDTDTDTAATVAFERDRATVYNDLAGRPSIIVAADTDRLRHLCRLRVAAGGLPPVGLGSGHGRHVIGQILNRQIRIKGLLCHLVTALQFLSLMSTAE
jgi:hypothetical protein